MKQNLPSVNIPEGPTTTKLQFKKFINDSSDIIYLSSCYKKNEAINY